MADPVAEFLQQAGLHPTRIDAARALAVAPGELLDMEILIKRPESALLRPNPYRGLASFRESDAPYFRGREVECDELLVAVESHPWVTMIGASGSGKSSLIFAGLVPRLRKSGRWQLASFRPKTDPFGELATALTPLLYPDLDKLERRQRRNEFARKLNDHSLTIVDVATILAEESPDQRLLLIADQFEEIFTQSLLQERQRSFIEQLLALIQDSSAPPVCAILMSLRADFLSQALANGLLVKVLDTYPIKILGSMDETSLRAAIESPAKQLGVIFEPGLTDRIIQDLGDAPGTLPLLEFTLSQLWDQQIYAKLDHATYEAVGGVNEALTEYADGILARYPDDEIRLRQIFIQLVRPGEGTEDTRQVATREQVGETNWSLVNRLADARLLITGRDEATGLETVEVVHEALIRSWRPLRQWVEQNRQFRVWQNRLRQAIEEWEEQQRDEGALLWGARLIEAQERFKHHPDELTPAERSYIQESLALRERERISRRRMRQRITFGLVTGLLIALMLGGLASWQWQVVDRQRLVAEEQRQIAFARGLGAQALQIVGQAQSSIVTERAAALALESWRRLRNADAYEAAADLCLILPCARIEHQNRVMCSTFSPDQSLLVTGYSGAPMRLITTENGKVLTTINYGEGIYRIAFSPDGMRFATSSLSDRTVRLFATENGRELVRIKDDKKSSFRLNWLPAFAFSPDGRLLATAGADGTAGIIDVLQGTLRARIKYPDSVLAVAFISDSSRLTSVIADGTARHIETGAGTESAIIKIGDRITRAVFSPNGRILATVSKDGTLRLLTMPEGQRIEGFKYKGQVKVVAFSPDSRMLVVAGPDDTARLITTADGLELALIKHGGGYLAVAFSQDSSLLAIVSSGDRMVRLITTKDGSERGRFPQKNKVNVAFSPNGRFLATIGSAFTARLISTKDGREVARIPHDAEVHGVGFSPGGRLFATHAGGTVQIFSTDDWNRTYIDHGYGVSKVALSRDNRLLATFSGKTVRLIDAKNGREIVRIRNPGRWPTWRALVFSPDGRLLVIGDGDKTVRLIYTENGQEVCSIEHGSKVLSLSFSVDGNLLDTICHDGIVRRIDTRAGIVRDRIQLDGPITQAIFSPDGRMLATALKGLVKLIATSNGNVIASFDDPDRAWSLAFSSDSHVLAICAGRTVRLIVTQQGIELASIHLGSHAAKAAFSPDLRLLATDSWNVFTKEGDVKLISLTNGDELYRSVFSEEVAAMGFTPDGFYLAIASGGRVKERGTVRLIDTRERKEVARIELGAIDSMALSPDGSLLAIGSKDGTARIWPMDPQKVFDMLCRRAGRNLSLNEWRDYGFDEHWLPTCKTWRNPTDVIEAKLAPKPTAEECLKYGFTYWRICPESKP
ncbi:MAG: hypothetical protein PVG70_00955 [Desulfobacterales bacterium]|jgi:WD40 repeat protein